MSQFSSQDQIMKNVPTGPLLYTWRAYMDKKCIQPYVNIPYPWIYTQKQIHKHINKPLLFLENPFIHVILVIFTPYSNLISL